MPRNLARFASTFRGETVVRLDDVMPDPLETTVFRQDGTTLPLALSCAGVIFDDQPYLFAVGRDISERKQAEEEQQKLIWLVQNSPDFIGVANLQQQALLVNRAGQQLVGLASIDDVRRTTRLDYFPPEEHERIRTEIMPVLFEKGHWDGEIHFKHFTTGTYIPMSWNVFTIPDPHTGQLAFFACVSRDLRAWNRAEELRKTITDNATASLFMMDAQGHCT